MKQWIAEFKMASDEQTHIILQLFTKLMTKIDDSDHFLENKKVFDVPVCSGQFSFSLEPI
jgi:hypothetical protein